MNCGFAVLGILIDLIFTDFCLYFNDFLNKMLWSNWPDFNQDFNELFGMGDFVRCCIDWSEYQWKYQYIVFLKIQPIREKMQNFYILIGCVKFCKKIPSTVEIPGKWNLFANFKNLVIFAIENYQKIYSKDH